MVAAPEEDLVALVRLEIMTKADRLLAVDDVEYLLAVLKDSYPAPDLIHILGRVFGSVR